MTVKSRRIEVPDQIRQDLGRIKREAGSDNPMGKRIRHLHQVIQKTTMNARAQDFDPTSNNAAQQEQHAQAIPPISGGISIDTTIQKLRNRRDNRRSNCRSRRNN